MGTPHQEEHQPKMSIKLMLCLFASVAYATAASVDVAERISMSDAENFLSVVLPHLQCNSNSDCAFLGTGVCMPLQSCSSNSECTDESARFCTNVFEWASAPISLEMVDLFDA